MKTTNAIILALAIGASSNITIAQDAPPPRPPGGDRPAGERPQGDQPRGEQSPIPSRMMFRAYDHNAKTGKTAIQITSGGKTVFVDLGQQVPQTDWKFESFELKDKGARDESVAKMVNVNTGQSLTLVVGATGGERPRGDQPRGDQPRGDQPRGDRPQGDFRPGGEGQPRGEGRPGQGFPGGAAGQGFRPVSPIIEALDANKDGTIDADELAKASEALKKLDKNGDGKITEDEFRPARPQGQGFPGGGQGGPGAGPEGRGQGRPGGPEAGPQGGRGEGRPPGGQGAGPGGRGEGRPQGEPRGERPQRPEPEQ